MVIGRLSPRMANSELVDGSEEIVTEAFLAVNVACRVALDPTLTLPKLSVAGFTSSSAPERYTANPVTIMLSGEYRALLTSLRMPLMYPLAVGVKMMGNSTLAPGWMITGNGKLPSEKALPCSDAEVICNVLSPAFVSWKE